MIQSEHFKPNEFLCPCCGRGEKEIDQLLVEKLEVLRENMNAKSIIITSGYRCKQHDKEIGGTGAGMHTTGGACDIVVYKKNGDRYNSFTIAREAEKIGFNGIGIIDNTACHVDIRGNIPYINNHWFGNEKTNEIYTTFAGMGEKIYYEENLGTTSRFTCPHCGKVISVEKG